MLDDERAASGRKLTQIAYHAEVAGGMITGMSGCIQRTLAEINCLLHCADIDKLNDGDAHARLLYYREELRALRRDIEQGEDAAEQAHRLIRELLRYLHPNEEIREQTAGSDQ